MAKIAHDFINYTSINTKQTIIWHMEPPLAPPFKLMKIQRGNKLVVRGYIYGEHRRVGEVTHWLYEKRGICNARIHIQGTEIVKRTNEHLHAPDEQAVSCCETKIGIKRRARESQDSSHHIVGESVVTVSEGTVASYFDRTGIKHLRGVAHHFSLGAD